ncbi:Oxysterol-binding protein-related protein 1D [Acorus calamus]|uniref:Oxysterol-binding protein-related protein 1D n=1 Tax=Acorus calamus TaxID=4465 RepID=A0AAV9EJF4_ACOCL|nr:Oxysterol-binding protein-related protein 1D [Acorus calamus]
MNPLCCISPVSLDRTDHHHHRGPQIGPVRVAKSPPKPVIVAVSDPDPAPPQPPPPPSPPANAVVAGVLYKWVNYGKGWRPRWFVIEGGVLSYYKIRGPDGISVGAVNEKVGFRVIGEGSLRRVRRCGAGDGSSSGRRWKPFGEVHLKVSSIRASKTDDKRLSIFSGTKTLHLRCGTREDRGAWIDALHASKDLFPRMLTSNDFLPSEDVVVSTEKLRDRLLQEGLAETVIKECESIMHCELSEVQNQLKLLQQKHVVLLDMLRQLETEKVELETTVIDETKERDSYAAQNGRFSAFAVSGYASTEGRQCKPFNPLLGETYEADYPDKGLHFFSEKVSHHPMIVACHCDGRGWKFWADSNLKGKFWGRSIQLDPIGTLTLQFDDGEMFQWSKVHGFVQDNRTGNKVAMLVGKWDEAMYYVLGDPSTKPKGYDPMSEAVLLWERDKSMIQTRYNLTPFAISLNELTPGLLEKLPPTDSRLRPDQRHLENGEYELANVEKLRLEQTQRQARKLQERGWKPRWFSRDKEDDCYRYVGGYWEAREEKKWDGIPDIFSQTVVPRPLSCME